MVAHALGLLDGLVDSARTIDVAAALDSDGVNAAAWFQLQGEAFHSSGGVVVRDGVAVGQTAGESLGSGELRSPGGGKSGRDQHRRSQD